jgi:hypothetical protein
VLRLASKELGRRPNSCHVASCSVTADPYFDPLRRFLRALSGGKGEGVRAERVFGAVGLGLFFLFPLLGLLQLGDGDDVWRTIAGRARPSVLVVHAGEATQPIGCAVVLQAAPARAVMGGTPPGTPLRSTTPAGSIEWTPRWVDPRGHFTLLEGNGPVRAASHESTTRKTNLSGLVPLGPNALRDVSDVEDGSQPVSAVLVSPPLGNTLLWVGELQRGSDSEDRSGLYRGASLRALQDPNAASAATADQAGELDPVLRGAPFVTRDGLVLALYLGQQDGVLAAVPMAAVREAVAAIPRASMP